MGNCTTVRGSSFVVRRLHTWPGSHTRRTTARFSHRFTTRVHDKGSRRGFRLRDGGRLKMASQRVQAAPARVSSPASGTPRGPTDWARAYGSPKPATGRQASRGEVVFPRSEAGAPETTGSIGRTNGTLTGAHDGFTDCDMVRAERAGRFGVTSASESFLRPHSHVAEALHLFAATEVFELEELTNLDLAFFGLAERCGEPSRPFHRLFS
jgi:hypothetical protein